MQEKANAIIKNNLKENLRDFFNLSTLKKAVQIGTDLFVAIEPVIEKRSIMNVTKSAFLVGKVIVDNAEVWADDYFDESWDSPYPIDFNKIILRAISKKPYKVIKTSDQALVVHMVELEPGLRLGYILNTKNDFVDRLFVESKNTKRAKEIIKKELWALLKDDNIVLRRSGKKSEEGEVVLEADDVFVSMPSKRSEEYSSYLRRCIDAQVPRAVLLYGPPGTGKSTMARTIVSTLGLRTFRIRVEDVGNIATSTLFEAIEIFEPDAVIMDDFDRSSEQAALLEILEYFQRHVKLVIATVNNRNMLDEAILRPGRFDELLYVKQMDEDVVKSVLGSNHADVFDLVKDWPIAFIQEFVKRRKFMSTEEAESTVLELAARVDRLKQYDDDGEERASFKHLLSKPRKNLPFSELNIKDLNFEFAERKSKRRYRKST